MNNLYVFYFFFFALVITCDEPEVFTGGYVVGYDLNVHSVIEYHCDVGYLLHGEAKHSCGKDGEWTGEVPSCECESLLFFLTLISFLVETMLSYVSHVEL